MPKLAGGDTTGGEAVTARVGAFAGGLFVRSWLSRASWSKMSDSVVFARLPPADCDWALEDEGGVCRGGAVDIAGAVGGAEGVLAVTAGDVGAIGMVELGRFVQASSSNPLGGSSAELDLAGGCTGVDDFVGDVATIGETVRWM